MKTQKFVLKTLYCLAGLLFLASIGVNIIQYRQFNKLSGRLTSEDITKNEPVMYPNIGAESAQVKTVKNTRMKNAAPEGKAGDSGTGEVKELSYQLNAAQEELDMTNDQLSEELQKKAEFKKAWYRPGTNRSDPVYKKMVRDVSTKQISEDYDPLFNKLNIPEEEFNKFKAMLVEKRIEIDSLSQEYSAAKSAEEKKKIIQKEKEIDDRYREKISDFLGRGKNEIYQAYLERLSERNDLNDFMKTQPPDRRIDDVQMDELIDSMYEARKVVYDEMDTVTDKDSSPELTKEKITRIIKNQALVNEIKVEASRGIMTPAQVEKFKAFLKQKQDMMDASLKMSLYFNENK